MKTQQLNSNKPRIPSMWKRIALVAVLCMFLIVGGVIAKDKTKIKSDLTITESLILKAKGYDNATASALSCSGDSCTYDLIINGQKMKTDPLPYRHQDTINNITVVYTDAELNQMQDDAIKKFYRSEYNRFTVTPTSSTKGDEKDVST